MQKSRLLVVIGTRPEAVKMAPVVHALRAANWAEVRVLATAQHRQLLDQILTFFRITPDRDLDLMRADQTLNELTARLLAALDGALAEERPDLVFAQGDTTTVMATALACFHRGIAFAHVEAGLRTGDFGNPFPEEMNRVLVARLATLHFAPTLGAQQQLLREGVPAARVHMTGNTVVDALQWAATRIERSEFTPPPGKRLVLVTAHRRENFGAPLLGICATLRTLAQRPDVQVLFPVHPNPNVQQVVQRELGNQPAIQLVAPLDYPRMVAAMAASTLILTDSGGVQEEAPSLRVPVLVLRTTTERPEGVATGVAKLVGTEPSRLVAAATELLDDAGARTAMQQAQNPYGDGHAADRIVGCIATWAASR